MEYKTVHMPAFKIIGFERTFSGETAYAEIPKFWGEIEEKYFSGGCADNAADEYKKAVNDNRIGEYAVCVDDVGGGKFRYIIGGRYAGGEVPTGMALYGFPEGDWAIFECVGAMPTALQTVNTRVFSEWLPDNPDYMMAGNANVEWYDPDNDRRPDNGQKSAIWVPIVKKR